MSDLSQRLAALSPEKRALLLKKLEQQRAQGQEKVTPAIARQSRKHSCFPLSFAQRRLWFLEQLEPGRALYHLALPFEARRGLDGALLRRCLDELAQRHESLRTVFAMRGDEPCQHLLPSMTVPLLIDDLSTLSASEARSEAEARLTQSLREPFDMAQGPLVRARLIHLPDQHALGCLYLHHLIADGWSLTILWRELVELYTALQVGQEARLAPIDLHYIDYAVWQRESLQGEHLESQLAYWRNQLQDTPPLLTLPTDHQRPPRQTFEGQHLSWELPVTLSQQVRELSRREQATPFMILLAAFQVLLARYSGQHDLVVGTPIAGRTRTEIEPIVGFFANTLALRTRMTGITSFLELVRQVREMTLEAYAHQEIPFDYLVEELHPPRNLGTSPIFQVMFVQQTAPPPGKESDPLSLASLALESQVAKFDLTCTVVETEAGLQGTFEYTSTLFEARTIQQLVRHWCLLVPRLLADPTRSIWHVSFLTSEEREQLLYTWNTGQEIAISGISVPMLFAQQARRTPTAQAIIWEEGTLSYAELNRRANQLARHLRTCHVGPETLVALCLDRSPEMLIAQLAVLKAGGAYVPLDPAYPPARLALLLADCAAPVALTLERYRTQLPTGQMHILCLDRDAEQFAQEDTAPPDSDINPDTLAYLIYTSGSTGLPKGTMVTHRSLAGRVVGFINLYHLESSTRQLQFVSPGFDISIEEILPTLCSGGAVVLYRNPLERTGLEFLQYCRRFGVTKINLPASYWHQIVDEMIAAGETVPPSLQISVAGGEKPQLEKLVLWQRAAHHPLRFFNVYGPTEGTILATYFELPLGRVDCTQLACLPLGHPFFNTRLYVLDTHQQLVPPGVAGELYLGGEGVARGYLKRPDVTAERFVPDPFSTRAGDRLYRTGDLVRYLPDGALEFLGRVDTQVKIRGFRIEPAEIEAQLAQHPTVKQCAVIVREDTPGEHRLVAYIVPNERQTTEAEQQEMREQGAATWRHFLQQSLPAYMLPAAYVVLPAFPLTPHQKIDYRALPAPEWSTLREGGEHQAPRTPVEVRLAQIWQEVLHHEHISIDEDFFEIGGHSLLATSLIARAQERFQVHLPLRSLFEHPTIQELAHEIEQLTAQASEIHTPPLTSRIRGPEVALSFAQQRLWFLAQLDAHSVAYNLPAALLWRDELDSTILEHSLEQLVQRHESLRTLFANRDGQPVQVILPTLAIPLHYLDYSADGRESAYEQALQWFKYESLHPFDLEYGPLMWVSLALLAPGEYLFGLCMHHSISDGWSLGLLLHELLTLYTAERRGETLALPPLPVQYADYALWQREWMQGERLQTQLRYWREHLAEAPPLLALPTDHPRPELQTYHGALIPWTIPVALAARLRELARQEQVTLFMLLLAAFQVLLARYSGQDDLVVGTPIAGRTRPETEQLLGCFVNTLPLRARLPAALSFRDLLHQVRETALGAYAHQEIPFEQLVEALQPERHLSYSPLFQVMFAFQQAPLSEAELARYGLGPVSLESPVARFDLTCAVIESEHALDGTFEYTTSLFEATTIQRLINTWLHLLEEICNQPELSVWQLPLLSSAERTLILQTWNAQKAHTVPYTYAQQVVEQQALLTPQASAIVSEQEVVTYAQLDARANQIANYLRNQEIGPEIAVGLCMERSSALFAGLLGILKAGGVYVPLDPTAPPARLAFQLHDARVRVLLTHSSLLPHFVGLVDQLPCICLDTEQERLQQESTVAPPLPGEPEQIAYIIYTSGSTGQPKGVQIPHRALVQHTLVTAAHYTLVPEDRVLQFAAFTFDVSLEEVFPTWSRGAAAVLKSAQVAASFPEFLAWLDAQRVSVINLPTPYWHEWMAEQARHDLPLPSSLRLVIVGSDQSHAEPLRTWYTTIGTRVGWCNAYGPTEATITTTTYMLPDNPQESPGPPPIGRPLPHARVYLLDSSLQPVPIGARGELYIGGEGLARGYLNQPALTAERFVPDPFSTKPGARLYRTGDLARYRSDGQIEFLGRMDAQVKIRGYRIEIGEIEAVLIRHTAVQECVVLVRTHSSGERSLVAYVSCIPRRQVEPGTLRDFLKEQLPSYMVPTDILVLPALPHTASGKIDRRALPDPGRSTPAAEVQADRRLPRTELEVAIAALWCEVLDRRDVGTEENFFDLGGHSLLLVRLHSLLRSHLQLDLTLLELFQYPTIQALVEHVQREPDGEAAEAAQALALSPERTRDRHERDQQRQRRRLQHQQARRLSGGTHSE